MLPRAATAPELNRLRLDGQWVELLACFPQPAIVFQARVSATPAGTDKNVLVTYDTPTGVLADVLPGMTIFFGTLPGAYDKGQARVRKTPTLGTLYLGTESDINLLAGDLLTVVDEQGIWQRQVRIDAGITYMDYEVAYTNQNTNRLPVVVMGGPAVVELIGPAVTAHFDASLSWVPGGGAATYLWAAPGASVVGATNLATFAPTYNVGGRFRVSCTVTIGAVANTRYEWVQVVDGAHPPTTQFQVRTLAGAKSQGGYSFQMTLYAQADLAAVRDRAQVILWTRDHYGSAGQVPTGYATGRENILCIGWISGESIVWSPDLSSVTFTVEGAHAWLGRVTAYPQGLEDVTGVPAQWVDYNTLTMTAFVWCVLTWRSTVAQAIDCIVEISSTRVIEMSAAATSLWEQLNVTAGQRLLAPPATDHLSRLFVLIEAQHRSDRSGVAEVMALSKQDWRTPLTLTRNPLSQASMVDLNGFAWDGTNATALFSLSPGRVWKRYGRVVPQQALLLTDQNQANTLAGLICGQANNEYPSVQIQLAANNRMLDIAPDCYVTLTLAASDTPRGVSFTGRRFVPRRISWAFDPASGGLLPTVDFEAETFGELAVTGDAPATEPVPPPPPPPPSGCPAGYHRDLISGLCVPNSGGGAIGDGNTVYVATWNKLARTRNFKSASPHWVDLGAGLVITQRIVAFCLYSFDPVNVGFVVTRDSVYLLTSLNTDTPVWHLIVSVGGLGYFTNTVSSPICTPDNLWVTYFNGGGGGAMVITGIAAAVGLGNYAGITFYTVANVTSGSGGFSPRRIIADFVDPDRARLVTRVQYGNSSGAMIALYLDRTGGVPVLTSSVIYSLLAAGISSTGITDYDVAYPDNALTQWYSGAATVGHSTNSGGAFTRQDLATPSGAIQIEKGWYYIINIATANALDVMVALPEFSSNEVGIWRTVDGGTTWTHPYSAAYSHGGLVALGRWPYDPNIVFFLQDTIYYSEDGLTTPPQDKLGDWVAVLGTWTACPVDAGPDDGPVMIVPLWLAAP